MDIHLIVHQPDGACEAYPICVPPGTTVEALFHEYFGGDPYAYRMFVNSYPVDWDYVLRDGDRASFKLYRRPGGDG
jgi:hypothetical protein